MTPVHPVSTAGLSSLPGLLAEGAANTAAACAAALLLQGRLG